MDIKYILSRLDFNEWFDFWHTHNDWDGKGNESWEKRQEHLTNLFKLFEVLITELKKKKLNHEFQIFCYILPEDSAQDGVYIHTKNPNHDNFPSYFEEYNGQVKILNKSLKFIEDAGFKYFFDKYEENVHIIIYKEDIGLTLKK